MERYLKLGVTIESIKFQTYSYYAAVYETLLHMNNCA